MDVSRLAKVIAFLEDFNAELGPGQLSVPEAKVVLELSSRAIKLASYAQTTAASEIDNAIQVARVTGTSIGKAKETVATGKVMSESQALTAALQHGEVSLDQATEIAKAEGSAPGTATELIAVAKESSFQVLKDKARDVKLTSEQHRDLGQRQRQACSARSYIDGLGMVNIHLSLEPHVGTPIVNRAEAEAQRLYRTAKKSGEVEPFDRYLADAYAKHLSGSGKGRTTRPELVVLVSREVTKRGWTDVRKGEFCKIPGVGPISPQAAKEIAQDAFLNGVFFDGVDLRNLKRFGRYRPPELQVALELGSAPTFDGIKCSRCGKRFRPEIDHIDPCNNGGESSLDNSEPLCHECHLAKTAADRKAGKLTPRDRKQGSPSGRPKQAAGRARARAPSQE